MCGLFNAFCRCACICRVITIISPPGTMGKMPTKPGEVAGPAGRNNSVKARPGYLHSLSLLRFVLQKPRFV